jgi:ubiquitin C
MQVMVESADGTTYRVRCNPDDRVADIKLYMRVEHGVPVDQQILIFEDERMEDGKMLSEYDIEDGSTILFMMQQLGC